MPGRVVIVAPQITPESLPWRFIADGARAEGLEAEWLAPAATENALRARLAAGDVRLIVLIGHGQSRGADHATIDLASSAGHESRAVNLRHLAGLLAAAARLEGVVLVPRDADGSPWALSGFAERVVANGVSAAMRWAVGVDLARSRTWFATWRDGHDWPALARLGGILLEHAGDPPAAADSNAAPTSGVAAAAERSAAAASAAGRASPAPSPAASPPVSPSRETIAAPAQDQARRRPLRRFPCATTAPTSRP